MARIRRLSSAIFFRLIGRIVTPCLPARAHGDSSQSCGRLGKFREPPGVPILGFGKTAPFDQVDVVGRVVCSKKGGRMLKTIDEQSANIIGGIIDRPHHFGSAFSTQPLARRRKERSCDIAIVDALEQTEAANVRLMKRIVIRIIARHDSPNNFAAADRARNRAASPCL